MNLITLRRFNNKNLCKFFSCRNLLKIKIICDANNRSFKTILIQHISKNQTLCNTFIHYYYNYYYNIFFTE
jgi:hypothetical protein